MKAVGLVAEYNPLHNGHLYHLKMAKQITKADVTVAVMSGNFTQRAEPTILDKWQRTKEALSVGVDLVVELPMQYAVQPAHLFASGALSLLDSLQIDDFVFGAEHPDWDFNSLVQAENKFESTDFSKYNATYATAFNNQLIEHTGISLTEPNDILAFGYTKAKLKSKLSVNLHPVKRVGSAYHDEKIDDTSSISSASAIRKAVKNGSAGFESLVPEQTAVDLKELKDVNDWNDLYPLLRYQLIQAPLNYLAQTYQMSEGLEHRLKQAAQRASDFDAFMRLAKSKRYTYSRIQRVCLYALLQISDEQMQIKNKQLYLRILGFNHLGQEYLHQIKKTVKIPIITKVDQKSRDGQLQLDYRAGKLYEQLSGVEQDMRRRPIIV